MGRLSWGEYAEFCDLLASAVASGMRLQGSLEILGSNARTKRLRKTFADLEARIRDGAKLSEALDQSAHLFPVEFPGLIRAGEESGRLDEILRHTSRYGSLRARFQKRIFRLCMYLTGAGLVLVAALGVLTHVVGMFSEIFRQVDVAMPTMTVIAMKLFGEPWLPAAAAIVITLSLAIGYPLFTQIVLRGIVAYMIPIWGRLQRNQDISVICTIVAARLQGGGRLVEAIHEAKETVTNHYLRDRLDDLALAVNEGYGLEEATAYAKFFPHTLGWGLGAAEKRNDVPQTFATFARVYSSEIERNFDVLFQILTPLGIILLGVTFTFTLFALFLPLMGMMEGIG